MPFAVNTAARRALRMSALALALCALGACSRDRPADQSAQAPAGQAPAQAPPQPAASDQLAAMGAEQLRQAAAKALNEQRLYAPAGDNAMEYYVALREKSPDDAAVASAITDLMPYVLIAAEQSIARGDFSEARRLYALMEKADPKAPALPRLKQGIADAEAALARRTAEAEQRGEEEARRRAELEAQRAAEQQRAQQLAAQQLAAQQAAAQQAAAQQAAAQQAAEREAAERRQAEQAASAPAQPRPAAPQPDQQQTAAAPAAPAPAPAAAPITLRPISTPAPSYPPEALRAGEAGEVVVEFTVNPDGSVSNARVVRASPPRTFDRAALSAVRRWRFQPVAEATTTRRTIGFTPGR